MSEQRKTNQRIFILAFLIAGLILLNGGFAYWQMHQVKQEFYDVANRDLPLVTRLSPLIDRQFEQTLLLEKLQQVKDPHKLIIVDTLEHSFRSTGDKFDTTLTTLTQFITPMLSSSRPQTREEMEKVKQLLLQIQREHSQYQSQVLRLIKAMKAADTGFDASIFDLLAQEEKDLRSELMSLRNEVQRFTQDSANAVERHEAWVIQGVVLFTLFTYTLGTLMLFMMRQVMQAREKAVDDLTFYATHDPLTGLANRRHFFERLDQAMHAARRHQTPLSLCVCDLDHFKQLNDQFGHQFGDQVLSYFAQLLGQSSRAEDITGRFGGDEFVICFPSTKASDAAVLIERVRQALESKDFNLKQNPELRVTATFGIAEVRHSDLDENSLFEAADKALYQAKEAGRNCIELHLPPE